MKVFTLKKMMHWPSLGACLLTFVCFLLNGCSSTEIGKGFSNLILQNAPPENFALQFDPIEREIDLSGYSLPKSPPNTDLELAIDLGSLQSNISQLTAVLTNNGNQPLELANPGSSLGDSLFTFLGIDKDGHIAHEFRESRIYSKETAGTFKVLPGKSHEKTLVLDTCIQLSIPSFKAVEAFSPVEILIVAKFEQPACYDSPAIGPVYSKPILFRVMKIPTE